MDGQTGRGGRSRLVRRAGGLGPPPASGARGGQSGVVSEPPSVLLWIPGGRHQDYTALSSHRAVRAHPRATHGDLNVRGVSEAERSPERSAVCSPEDPESRGCGSGWGWGSESWRGNRCCGSRIPKPESREPRCQRQEETQASALVFFPGPQWIGRVPVLGRGSSLPSPPPQMPLPSRDTLTDSPRNVAPRRRYMELSPGVPS